MTDQERQNVNGAAGVGNRTGAGYGSGVGRGAFIANPGPLGLLSFAGTSFILSLYAVRTRGVVHPDFIIGMALFVGGLAQFLAGMWEFPRGNTFWATAFSLYGTYYMSLALIYLPSGATSAYSSVAELNSAYGIYLMTWFMITFFILLVAVRRSVSHIAFFAFLTLTFALFGAGRFASAHNSVTIAGGAFGIITSLIAFYMGFSKLLWHEKQHFLRLPLGNFGINNTAGATGPGARY